MSRSGMLYADSGVDTQRAQTALQALRPAIEASLELRPGEGRALLPLGYFANVLALRDDLGLAITTDGVGTKALVAQLMDKYDTIGIDCVAMNANDVVCVGAKPIAMTDYVAVEATDPEMFRQLGIGLLKGARLAGISVPGGEIAQVPDMIKGLRPGLGFDLVGTCVGVVAPDRILIGQAIEPGDVVVGLSSSGIHSNGLSLARKALLESERMGPSDFVPELGRSLGEELLTPTAIYVGFAMDALRADLEVKAFIHITSDGLLNLLRVAAPVSFELDSLPEPQPIFRLVQQAGMVPDEEIYQVFNMGVGFCAVVPPQHADAVCRIAEQHNHKCQVIGRATVAESYPCVRIPSVGLEGRGDSFYRV